jgi:hypothetical protein
MFRHALFGHDSAPAAQTIDVGALAAAARPYDAS